MPQKEENQDLNLLDTIHLQGAQVGLVQSTWKSPSDSLMDFNSSFKALRANNVKVGKTVQGQHGTPNCVGPVSPPGAHIYQRGILSVHCRNKCCCSNCVGPVSPLGAHICRREILSVHCQNRCCYLPCSRSLHLDWKMQMSYWGGIRVCIMLLPPTQCKFCWLTHCGSMI